MLVDTRTAPETQNRPYGHRRSLDYSYELCPLPCPAYTPIEHLQAIVVDKEPEHCPKKQTFLPFDLFSP